MSGMTDLSTSALWLFAVFVVSEVCSSEVCVYDEEIKICEHGCCSSGCCLSPYQIAGIVFGALAFVCLIAALILYCVKRQKRNGRVIHDGQPRVMMVNGYNQPVAYSTTQPFAPGYAASYGHPGVPPPYGAAHHPGMHHQQYPAYGGFPAQPPPAYSYHDAGKNPFAAAANQATSAPSQATGGSSYPAAS